MSRKLRDYDIGAMTAYELVDALDQLFPRITPRPGDTLDYLMHEGGKRDLVETLLKLKERSQNG